jgi:excisionase family DNA binding protein
MAARTQTVTAYNINEAASRVGVSRWTINRAIRAGELNAHRTGKRSVVIYADDLLEYVLRYRPMRRIEAVD